MYWTLVSIRFNHINTCLKSFSKHLRCGTKYRLCFYLFMLQLQWCSSSHNCILKKIRNARLIMDDFSVCHGDRQVIQNSYSLFKIDRKPIKYIWSAILIFRSEKDQIKTIDKPSKMNISFSPHWNEIYSINECIAAWSSK